MSLVPCLLVMVHTVLSSLKINKVEIYLYNHSKDLQLHHQLYYLKHLIFRISPSFFAKSLVHVETHLVVNPCMC